MGVELAIFQGSLDILLEFDSLMGIDEVNKDFDSTYLWEGTIFDIVNLSRVIMSCNFLYKSRESNSLACNLVKCAKSGIVYDKNMN